MTVTFDTLPTTMDEFSALIRVGFTQPERTASLFILAMNMYTKNANTGVEAINALKGPAALSPRDVAWLKDRLYDKLYLPMVYFKGSTPENSYTPAQPYTLEFLPDPRPQDLESGYMKLYLKTPAFDTPRGITLRNKGSDWFVWDYNNLMLGVRTPVKDDPWA